MRQAGTKVMTTAFESNLCMQLGNICVDYCDNPNFRGPCVLNTCAEQMACTNVSKASPVYKTITSFRQVVKTSQSEGAHKGGYTYYEDDMVSCAFYTEPDCTEDKYTVPNFMIDYGQLSRQASDSMASFQCWIPEK